LIEYWSRKIRRHDARAAQAGFRAQRQSHLGVQELELLEAEVEEHSARAARRILAQVKGLEDVALAGGEYAVALAEAFDAAGERLAMVSLLLEAEDSE
jgi:hypothetical protein